MLFGCLHQLGDTKLPWGFKIPRSYRIWLSRQMPMHRAELAHPHRGEISDPDIEKQIRLEVCGGAR
jgi:hypothetical protein